MSKKMIAGNWKMNLNFKNSLLLADRLSKILNIKKSKNEIVVFPDFSSLSPVSEVVKSSQIKLGAQNVAHQGLGAYTGEVAVESLSQLSCRYVLIGHSERRQYFFDNELIADKLSNVIKNSKITPILCVGENLSDRRLGKTYQILNQQLKQAFSKIDGNDILRRKIVIAYEPVWAIGTGMVAEVNDIVVAHKKIKERFFKIFPTKNKAHLRVLYGGSVNVDNFLNLQDIEGVDGLLVGGASLKAGDFLDIAYNF